MKAVDNQNVNLNAISLRREIKNGCEVIMSYEQHRVQLIPPVVLVCEFYQR